MLSKEAVREILQQELEKNNVDFADEIADSMTERLDEEGIFEVDEETE